MGQNNQKEQILPIETFNEVLEEAQVQDEKLQIKIKQALRNSLVSRQQTLDPKNQKNRYNEQDKQMNIDDYMLKKESINNSQPKILISGLLEKQSPSIFGSWDKRYCQLKLNHFIYYEGLQKESKIAGNLNFNLLSCTLLVSGINETHHFKIKVAQSEKEFIFRGENQEITNTWAENLKIMIDNSLGKKYNLTYLAHYHRFWRKEYFSEYQFRITAEIGDLVLFRGNKDTALLQRTFTLQQYGNKLNNQDHIAVVLKNARNQILLFQANGLVGVGVCAWRNFIKKEWFKDQDLVVYRKLHIERTQKFYQHIERFVEKNIGKKYKFSVKKMLLKRTSEPDLEGSSKDTYFCSSLVAALYKSLGIISQQISSSQYMPYTFSQKQNLQLVKNGPYGKAYLGKQKIIVFQQKFFNIN